MARKTDIPSSYYGEPSKFDPNFRGPVHKRSCTDMVCCVIFIVVIVGYIALGTVAWIHGDPRKVVYPTDSFGQFCGHPNTPNANKAILLYFNMLKCANPSVLINLQCPTTQICVSRCPDRFETLADARPKTQNWRYYKQFCKPRIGISSKSAAEILRDEDCPSMIVPSRPFLQRCFPDFITRNGILTVGNQTTFSDADNNRRSVNDLQEGARAVNSAPRGLWTDFTGGITNLMNAKEIGLRIFEDYANSWDWILIGLVITMAVSLGFILLLRFTAGVLLWLIIFGVIAAIGFGIWHCYWEFSTLSGKPGANVSITDIGFHTDFSIYLQLSQTWLVFMVSLCVIEGIIVVMLIFLRKRLCIAIALLKEGSKAISYIMSALFYPIITFFLLAICIAYWAVIAVFLASSGDAVYKVTPADNNCMYANLTCNPQNFNGTNITRVCPGSQCMFAFYGGESVYHRNIIVLHLCNLFMFLWLVNFTIALGQCTLAGAFASYYWALKKPDDIPACPLYSAFSRAIRYHTGSLAFGSLILAVVQMIRIILEYLDKRLKGHQNGCTRFVMCCLKCCFWCLEHFIRFINRNAYIMIAIYGKNFCTSSRNAFFLLMRNVIRVAVLDKVTDFLLFLGKLLISGSVGVLAFFFFTRKIPVIQEKVPSLNYYWVPLLTVIFGSYMIAHGFFNVYAMCVDTLFLCFLRDLEANDGSPGRPYYMNKTLRRILNKRNLGLRRK
ncbi:choline transporter-like protein 5-B isoform X2 [Sebastes umbrosus]|uniref:choline transporter-like protein 5-B isoform X2 n=1 Tax=Sebastes umbrosus TaxID=72105 RepID=UPI00189C8B4B|nr:choline transporter-like protein 5-B isoform X2 [Sebastes umbrosus]